MFILVIAGTWMIATTGTCWAIGPVEEEPYAECIGIGLENTTNRSYTPLLTQVEEPVQNKAERGSTLDLLTAFAEFDKHQADK
ncbi:hypothetical protein [Corynebacterium stationis]|uniref:hypothetical protein n=1 Tax=Corynebacterium stationis TaxID=1705 RepID=UPI0009526DBC|nr:hypothetical protein [Corynebacterium stationis]